MYIFCVFTACVCERVRVCVCVCVCTQEALRIGDQIRTQRNHELTDSTFKAWRLQVGCLCTHAHTHSTHVVPPMYAL